MKKTHQNPLKVLNLNNVRRGTEVGSSSQTVNNVSGYQWFDLVLCYVLIWFIVFDLIYCLMLD